MSIQLASQNSVTEEFEKAPTPAAGTLKACVVGPSFQLIRYSDATEKLLGSLGAYDFTQEVCYAWPNLTAGNTVDLTYSRLFIDDALLQYFYDPAGGSLDTIKAIYCDATVALIGNEAVKNAIRGATTVWKTYGVWARSAVLEERDVKVGDAVHVEADVSGTVYELDSHVAGFMYEEVDGEVGVATEDPNNVSAQFEDDSSSSSATPSDSWEKIGYATNDIDISAVTMLDSDRPEHSFEDGVAADIYTLRIVTGGAPGVARMSVTSDSGTDDDASVLITAFAVDTAFGAKGVSVTFAGTDDFVVGMAWEVTVEWGAADLDVSAGGSYTGPTDTTYIVEVTTGGTFANSPEVTITTTTGIDFSGPTQVTALGTAIVVGSYGVTLTLSSDVGGRNGLYLGDRFYVPATAASAGAIQTLLLEHDLPSQLLGLGAGDVCGTPPDLSVTLYIEKDIEVTANRTGYAPLTNWEDDATEICVQAGILAYDSSWVDSGGDLLPMQVKSGDLYVQYRALRTADANQVLMATAPDVGDTALSEYVKTTLGLGVVVADNPLALGTYLALLNAGSQEVVYIGVETDNLAGYTKAFNRAGVSPNAYRVTPLSAVATIQQAAKTHVDALSVDVDGLWRATMISIPGLSESGLITADTSGDPVLATIKEDPGQAGVQFVLVETASAVNFITSGVTAGDILRTAYVNDGFGNFTYSEYVVSSVPTEDSLILVAGPDAAVTVATKVEIWRTLSTDQMVTALVTATLAFNDERVCVVWPDYLAIDSVMVAGHFLCSALAGLQSTILPHRSLEQIEVLGFDGASRSTELLTRDNLDTLRDGGIMVVYTTEADEVYVRRAVTSYTTDSTLEYREEVMVRNADSIRHEIAAQLSPYKGAVNLTPSVVAQLKVEVEQAVDFLINSAPSSLLGPQLVGAVINRVEQHATLLNRLVVVITVDLPAPFSELELQVIV